MTTTSQAPGKELLGQLGLTSEVGKALKLSAKSMTDDKWKQHDVQHLGCTAMVTTKTSIHCRHALYYVITQMACWRRAVVNPVQGRFKTIVRVRVRVLKSLNDSHQKCANAFAVAKLELALNLNLAIVRFFMLYLTCIVLLTNVLTYLFFTVRLTVSGWNPRDSCDLMVDDVGLFFCAIWKIKIFVSELSCWNVLFLR